MIWIDTELSIEGLENIAALFEIRTCIRYHCVLHF